MIVQRFIRWCETADSGQRADGFAALARSLNDGSLDAAEQDAGRTALHLAADDPSPKVRLALAREIAQASDAPRTLIRAFLADNDEIALTVANSPVLAAADLVEALRHVGPSVQEAIAMRVCLPAAVATAVAIDAHLFACRALAANGSAALTPAASCRLARRFGNDAPLRSALLDRDDLAADIRQTLMLEAGQALATSPFVAGVLGAANARRIAFEASERATSQLGEWVEPRDVPDLVEHLRATGQISAAFLVRAVCAGNIDLAAAAMTALSGLSAQRVRAIVVDCRDRPFLSLVRTCGLCEAVAGLLLIAVRQWKSVATRAVPSQIASPDQVMDRVLAAYRRQCGARANAAVSALLARLENEIGRDTTRRRLVDLMAA